MISRAFLCVILSGVFHSFVAARAVQAPIRISIESRSGRDSQNAFLPGDVHINFESIFIAPAAEPTSETTTMSNMPDYPFPLSSISTPFTTSAQPATTITVTDEESITITASASPTTVTEFITITYSANISSTVSSSAPSPSPGDTGTIRWAAPKNFSNLDSFQVEKYSGGTKNLKIVTGVPAEASATARLSKESKMGDSPIPWDNSSAVMQIFYPAGSVNPDQSPRGGAQFYAAPLDISAANNVSLEYSVFFPNDFDWVLAGKLPGLYGGHTGCSGGNAALDCFSTRLMWRKDGAGELYLYAPKDKQTDDLCDDPESNCDAAYGLSVGRASFTWAAGAWTTIRQTVSLNTPGKQDGSFTLEVNGVRRIDRNDIFYRENSRGGKHTTDTTHAPTKTTSKTHHAAPTTTSTDEDPLLGPLLGGLLKGLQREGGTTDVWIPTATANPDSVSQSAILGAREPTSTSNSPTIAPRGEDTSVGTEAVKETEVKLIGIFFSTFFGGHEEKYATPRDQYVWFKDFALSYDS